jgi:hypothetical protein
MVMFIGMQQDGALAFTPSPIRAQTWIAEPKGMRYTVYESLSGFLAHYERTTSDATGQTPAPHRLRTFFSSFEEAARACREHYDSRLP